MPSWSTAIRAVPLSPSSAREGSAAYVALDAVSGRLAGREGSFVLEHHGVVSPAGAETVSYTHLTLPTILLV